MKKILTILLTLVMMLSLSACGGSKVPEQTVEESETTSSSKSAESSEPEESSEEEAPVSGEITLEDLMNAPESPESDFECIDSGEGEVELITYTGTSEIVVIPETWNGKKITSISPYVFGVQSSVKAVRIANSVKKVYEFAFSMNSNLEIVVCGNEVVELGNSAFQGCINLKELILNEGLVKVGHISIGGCERLKSVRIPATVTDISHMAFYGYPDNFTIICEAGSYAEEYAKTSGIPFEVK